MSHRRHGHPVIVVLLLPAAAIALMAHSCVPSLEHRGAAAVAALKRVVPVEPARPSPVADQPRIVRIPPPAAVVRPRTRWSI